MPIWLLSALPYLKKALPYLGGLALLLTAYWWADNRGRDAQKAKDAKAISALTNQRDSWIAAFHQSDANFHSAMSAVTALNADARKLADAYDRSKIVDAQNIAASNARWDATQKRLSALQGVIAKNGGCVVDPVNMDALEGL